MKYQLVLQFPSDLLDDESAVAKLEQELVQVLGDRAYVDGADLGPAKTSIFVFTADPTTTFRSVTPLLVRKELLDAVTAAHRPVDAEQYTVIWPEEWRKEFKLL